MTLTPEEIRKFIRDFGPLNFILDNEEEFSDEEINTAIELALSVFNSTLPLLKEYSLGQLPDVLKRHFMYQTVAELLKMRVFELQRNNLQYQSGNTAIDYNAIIQLYKQTYMELEQQAQQAFTQYKVQLNVNSVVDQLPSPESSLGWW